VATPLHSNDPAGPTNPDPDLLAAVVLHVLLAAAPASLTLAQTAIACERDPADGADRAAIERALIGLVADGLASHSGALFAATRAALRAEQLSF
jgi:hypothetical protein